MGFHRSGLLLFLALIWVKATSFDAEALLMPLILSRRLQLVSWTRPTTSQQGRQSEVSLSSTADEDGDADLSLDAFQAAKGRIQENALDDEFDGYALRDVIVAKWGKCYDVDFNRVQSFGFKKIYLNVMPFHLGRRPFRHATEYDYLCHLQAVVEILQDYKQLSYVLYQIEETTKKPIPGRVPLVAVPLRLDLTEQQVDAILG